MKKILVTITILLTISINIFSQVPEFISYQAVARNTTGEVLSNTDVSLRISILSGSTTGMAVYEETHSVTTNSFGLINLKIGGGNPEVGVFSEINWSLNVYFAKIEIDINNGTNYVEVGVSQMLSVPYALQAKNVEKVSYSQLIDAPLIPTDISELYDSTNTLFDGNYNSLSNLPLLFSGKYTDLIEKPMQIIPRIGAKGHYVTVSFSGGDEMNFSQASNTCPSVWANAQLKFSQGSSTVLQGSSTIQASSTIEAIDVYFIDNKRFDVIFDIPYFIPSGFYDIILGPNTPCQKTINSSFKVR